MVARRSCHARQMSLNLFGAPGVTRTPGTQFRKARRRLSLQRRSAQSSAEERNADATLPDTTPDPRSEPT